MQVTETLSEGLKKEFKIVLTAAEVGERVTARLNELARTAQLPGFRRGKVPPALLRKRFGQSLFAEEVQNAVRDSVRDTIQEHNLRPALEPRIDVQRLEPEQDIEFTMALEELPVIENAAIDGIKLERLTAAVTDEAVDEALQRIAAQQRRPEPAAEGHAAEKGDVLVVDYEGSIDGVAFEGGRAENVAIQLGSSGLLPEFDTNLEGAKAGDTRTFDLTFPEKYHAAAVAGKTASFTVSVKEVRRPVEVPIDEDFAKSLGAESLEALRNTVRDQLGREYAAMSRSKLKRDLLDVLAERHNFDVPPTMVEMEFDQIWRQVERARERGEIDEEDKGKTEEQLREEYRAIANRRVRLGLLLSDVGTKNQITVSDDELTRAVIAEARRYPGQEQKVFEFYQKQPQAQQALRGPIFEDKVVDFLIERAEVTERKVSVEELAQAAVGLDIGTAHLHDHGHDHDHDHDHHHHDHDHDHHHHDHDHDHGHDHR